MALEVTSDSICVVVYKQEDHPVGYGAWEVDEIYGEFGGWKDAWAFEQGLQLPQGQKSESKVLRNPKLSPRGVKPEDFPRGR